MTEVARFNPLAKPATSVGETAAEELALSAREVGGLKLTPVMCGEFGTDIPAMADLQDRIVVPVDRK